MPDPRETALPIMNTSESVPGWRRLLVAALVFATSAAVIAAPAPRWRDDWRSGASSRGLAMDALVQGGTLVVVGDRTGSVQGFVSGFDPATGNRVFTRASLTEGEA